MERSADNINRLRPTRKQIEGTKRKLNGYNVYLGRFFADFRRVNEDEKKRLLCAAGIHDMRDYVASDEDSVVTKPSANNIDIIRLAALRWRHTVDDVKEAWKLKAGEINRLPILGVFTCIPKVVTDDGIAEMLSQEHNRFIRVINNTFRSRQTVKDSTVIKSFGNEKVLLGANVYKSIFINHLLKLIFFGSNYSIFAKGEVVHRYAKSIIVHISSMERIIRIFRKNGKSAFSMEMDCGQEYSCAGKVVVWHIANGKQGIEYIINSRTMLMESGERVPMSSIRLPMYDKDEGRWMINLDYDDSNALYSVIEYNPIRMKICESGNCQIAYNVILLSPDGRFIIPNY